MIYGEKNFGVFIDYPGRVKFDVGYSRSDELKIEIVMKTLLYTLLKEIL